MALKGKTLVNLGTVAFSAISIILLSVALGMGDWFGTTNSEQPTLCPENRRKRAHTHAHVSPPHLFPSVVFFLFSLRGERERAFPLFLLFRSTVELRLPFPSPVCV